MEMFGIIKFKCSYDEWKSIYDGDIELRKQFMKDDIIGKVDEHTAMFKATITDLVKMDEIMSNRMEEIGPKLGLKHDFFSLAPIEN
jgi:hypothetical protein